MARNEGRYWAFCGPVPNVPISEGRASTPSRQAVTVIDTGIEVGEFYYGLYRGFSLFPNRP